MNTRMNTRMKNLLRNVEVRAYLDQGAPLVETFQSLVESSLVQANGCFFLAPLLPEGFNAELSVANSFDRTDLECSVNDICIQAFLRGEKQWTAFEVFAQGYKYATQLAERLETHGHFKVLMSFYGDASTDEDINCTVRFHRVRPGEDWASPNLEGYEEAVLDLETSSD